ncbi:MAG TPA: hypothetical protein ENH75_13140 [archaeon]|nr:hypothetical protein [archaeon]
MVLEKKVKSNFFTKKVFYIDANNRFNPYKINKLAASKKMTPGIILKNIFISRAFTFEQIIEVLENKIYELENVRVLIVSGITNLWPNDELSTFEGLLQAISGIKKTLLKNNPLIIITAPLNKHSNFKPQGGKYLAHFGSVLIMIKDND